MKLDAATAKIPSALNDLQPVNTVMADGSPQDAVAAAIAQVKAWRLEVQSGAARWPQDNPHANLPERVFQVTMSPI